MCERKKSDVCMCLLSECRISVELDARRDLVGAAGRRPTYLSQHRQARRISGNETPSEDKDEPTSRCRDRDCTVRSRTNQNLAHLIAMLPGDYCCRKQPTVPYHAGRGNLPRLAATRLTRLPSAQDTDTTESMDESDGALAGDGDRRCGTEVPVP